MACALLLATPALAAAEPIALCADGIPDDLLLEMRLELVARGHQVSLACSHQGWTVGIDSASLAEVWVWAHHGDGRRRRSRIPRSLDAVDGRALGIAAATVLSEEDHAPADPSESHERERDPIETEPVDDPYPEADPEPVDPETAELPTVRSSRALTPDTVVFLGGAGTFGHLEERHGGGGALFAIGRHLRATVRLDAGVVATGARGRALLGAWVGLTRVWRPAAVRWLEVGAALRYAQDIVLDGNGARIGVGAETHVALQRKLPIGGRLFWRLSAAPLIALRDGPRFAAEAVLSFGMVITP